MARVTISSNNLFPGPKGPKGEPGDTGPTGPTGATGPGVVTGGTAGQALTKIDGTNYNTQWTTIPLLSTANTFTGSQTATSFVVTGSTIPANGIYLPSANTLGLATNSTLWMQIDSSGNFGIGSAPVAGQSARFNKSITGSISGYGISSIGTIQSDVTSSAQLISTLGRTAAASFTLGNLYHYYATQGTFGVGSTVTSQYGYMVESNMTGATNNFGFYSSMASAANRWNIFMIGTAANYFAGQTTIGSTSLTLGSGSVAQQFGVVASAATSVGAVIRGAASQTADLQQWQNSAGTVLAYVTSAGGFVTSGSGTFVAGISLAGGNGNIIGGGGLTCITLGANRNIQMGSATGSYGGGQVVIGIANATTVPNSNPTGGGVLYAEAGALKWRGSSGTITTIANA